MSDTHRSIQYGQYASAEWKTVDGEIINETPVSLTVNGEVWLTLMCTPVDLDALAAGFLFNEGLLQSKAEIADLRVCPTGENVDIWLTHSVEKPSQWRRTSGCTGGVTSVDDGSGFSEGRPHLCNGAVLTPMQVCSLIEALFESQDLYRRSGGVHTSALSDGKSIMITAEDIGRHNTLDKIAGRCLLDGISLERKVLLTTGRISSEMIQKAARIGAAIVITRTSPSSASIQKAEQWGITLIGYARRNRFNLYTNPQRVLVQNEERISSVGLRP